jgi:hypothetical protein
VRTSLGPQRETVPVVSASLIGTALIGTATPGFTLATKCATDYEFGGVRR